MPERPDQLEALAPLAPLVEQHEREHEREQAVRAGSQAAGIAVRRPPRRSRRMVAACAATNDEQQPVEQPGRGVVELADAAPRPRRAGAPRATAPRGTGGGRRRTSPRRPRGGRRGAPGARRAARRDRRASRSAVDAPGPRLVEVAHERVDEPPARARGTPRAPRPARWIAGRGCRPGSRRSGAGRRRTAGPCWRRGRRGRPRDRSGGPRSGAPGRAARTGDGRRGS